MVSPRMRPVSKDMWLWGDVGVVCGVVIYSALFMGNINLSFRYFQMTTRHRGVAFVRKMAGNQSAPSCSDFLPECHALCWTFSSGKVYVLYAWCADVNT
jgi:hypothetical protein